MATAVDPRERVEYSLMADLEAFKKDPEKKPTKFFLMSPSGTARSRLQGKLVDIMRGHGLSPEDFTEENVAELPYEISVEQGIALLEVSLVGWDNLLDKQGRAVPFKRANPKANLDRIDPDDQEELAAEASRLAGFIGEEAKNSDGLSTSVASPKTSVEETDQDASTKKPVKTPETSSPTGQSTKKK